MEPIGCRDKLIFWLLCHTIDDIDVFTVKNKFGDSCPRHFCCIILARLVCMVMYNVVNLGGCTGESSAQRCADRAIVFLAKANARAGLQTSQKAKHVLVVWGHLGHHWGRRCAQ